MHELFNWPAPMTHRQYVVWQAWIALDMSEPSRTDNYIMQMTLHVDRIYKMLAQQQGELKLSDYHLSFGEPKPKVGPVKKPGKIPLGEKEWFPTPLTKADIEEVNRRYAMSRFKR